MLRGVIQYTRPPDVMAREMRRIVKDALMDVVRFWHGHFLPKHFTTAAVGLYGYKPRTAGYMIRKAKNEGHQKPLVWAGELQRSVTEGITVTGTSKGATGRMNTGARIRYLRAEQYNPNQPNKVEELTAIHVSEIREMAEELQGYIVSALAELREPRQLMAA